MNLDSEKMKLSLVTEMETEAQKQEFNIPGLSQDLNLSSSLLTSMSPSLLNQFY